MSPHQRGCLIATAVLMLVAAGLVALSLDLGRVARVIPLAVTVPTAILLTTQFAVEWKAARLNGARTTVYAERPPETPSELAFWGWTVGLISGVYLAGMAAAAPLFTLAYLRAHARCGWRDSVVVAGIVWLTAYWLMQRALQLQVYEGHLSAWLAGLVSP